MASSTRCSRPERVSYEDLARASSDTSSTEPPSILKSIFHDTSGNDGLLGAWLASDARDAEIESKEATRELTKLVLSRLGLQLPDDRATNETSIHHASVRSRRGVQERSQLRPAGGSRRRADAENEG